MVKNIPIIGSTSRMLNLAIEDWIESHSKLQMAVNHVRELMPQLKAIRNSTQFMEITSLDAVSPNETR